MKYWKDKELTHRMLQDVCCEYDPDKFDWEWCESALNMLDLAYSPDKRTRNQIYMQLYMFGHDITNPEIYEYEDTRDELWDAVYDRSFAAIFDILETYQEA